MRTLAGRDIVTVFADASFDHEYGIGAYAFWIKGPDGLKVEKSGVLRDEIGASSEAETLALANGIIIAARAMAGRPNGIRIVCASDCLHAIRALDPHGEPPSMRANEVKARRLVTELVADKTVEVRLRHVRGHQKGGGPRGWVNNWCDTQARAEMEKARGQRVAYRMKRIAAGEAVAPMERA